MMKLMFNHEFLRIKFLKAGNQKVYVFNTKENKIYSLVEYKKLYIFFHNKEEYDAVLRHIEIAEHYDECMAGTWKPTPVEKKFNRV